MRKIANGQCNDEVLRSLFMKLLPSLHRQILATNTITDLTQLADRMYDEMPSQTSADQQATSLAAIGAPYNELMLKVDAITNDLTNLKQRLNNSNDECGRYN